MGPGTACDKSIALPRTINACIRSSRTDRGANVGDESQRLEQGFCSEPDTNSGRSAGLASATRERRLRQCQRSSSRRLRMIAKWRRFRCHSPSRLRRETNDKPSAKNAFVHR